MEAPLAMMPSVQSKRLLDRYQRVAVAAAVDDAADGDAVGVVGLFVQIG
jgi:hypothetical protein